MLVVTAVGLFASTGFILFSKSAKNKENISPKVEQNKAVQPAVNNSLQTLEDLEEVNKPAGYYLDVYYTTPSVRNFRIMSAVVAKPWMKNIFFAQQPSTNSPEIPTEVTAYIDFSKWQTEQLVYQYYVLPNNLNMAMKIELKTPPTEDIIKFNNKYEKKYFRFLGEETVNGFPAYKFYNQQNGTSVWYTKNFHLLTKVQGDSAGEVFEGNNNSTGTFKGEKIIEINAIYKLETPTSEEVQLPVNITVVDQGTLDFSKFNPEMFLSPSTRP